MFPIGRKAGRGAKGRSGRKTKAEELAGATALKKLEIELARVQNAMADKELSKEEYKTLVDATDKLIKNIQLLGGKPTEIIDDYANFTTEELERRIDELEKGTVKEGAGKTKT